MIKTLGLTHLALTVSDLERSFQFYHDVFGMLAVYREKTFLQAQTPGARDVLVLSKALRALDAPEESSILDFVSPIPATSTGPPPPSRRRVGRSSTAANSFPASPTSFSPIQTATRSRCGTRSRPIACDRTLGRYFSASAYSQMPSLSRL